MGRLSKEEILKDKRPKLICSMCGLRTRVTINSIRNIYTCLNCGDTNMKPYDYSNSIGVYDHE